MKNEKEIQMLIQTKLENVKKENAFYNNDQVFI